MRSTTKSNRSPQTGSSDSPRADTSRPVASNDEASPTLPPQMSRARDSGTSSPVSACGPTLFDSLVSPTMPASGRARARVSLSRPRARGAERATLDIFGQHGSHSSRSVALQSSLESRLRARTDSRGSTLFSLTWNDAVTVGAADLCAAGIGAPHIRQRLYFVAYANAAGLGELGLTRLQANRDSSRGDDADGRSEAGELADTVLAGRTEGRASAGDGQTARRSGAGVVDHAAGVGPQRGTRTRRKAIDRTQLAGGTRNPWRHCEWIPCVDGASRPVEPGTFPLAHGAPARVGRLRGYGNAIVAPLATAFIQAAESSLT